MRLELSPFAAEDIERCLDLFISVFNRPPWHDKWTTQTARANLEDASGIPGAFGLVARSQAKVIGFVLGHREIQDVTMNFYIKELCVSPEYQGQGVGKQILRRLEAELKERGVDGIYLLTARGSPAEAFYKRLGFHYEETVVMGKGLS